MLDLALPSGQLRVLAIGAHPDDVEIGCGGMLLRLAERPEAQVRVLLMTGTPDRVVEAQTAARNFLGGALAGVAAHDLPDGRLPAHWGAVKEILEEAATDPADLLLVPRRDDRHQDHRTVAELVTTVWRDHLVLRYEIPKWDGDLSDCDVYVPMDEAVARRKADLLDACYPSQRGRDWWSQETFLSLMRIRGMQCRAPYAEAFELERAILTLSS